MRGRLLLGADRRGRLRLEAVAPFGAPLLVLAASERGTTLVLPRDGRVLEGAALDDVLDALVGLRLGGVDLYAVLTGCPPGGARAAGGRRYPGRLRTVILDGVVRTVAQAEGVERLLAERGRKIVRVVFLDVSDEEILGRIDRRRTLESRADDAPEAVARRLEAYREQTAPVLSWYEARGGVVRIPGAGTVQEIASRIEAALGR